MSCCFIAGARPSGSSSPWPHSCRVWRGVGFPVTGASSPVGTRRHAPSPLSEPDGKDVADVVSLQHCIGCHFDEAREVHKPAVIVLPLGDAFSEKTLGGSAECIGLCHQVA